MTRLEELEKILENVCRQYENDCSKCPNQKERDEYCRLGCERTEEMHGLE